MTEKVLGQGTFGTVRLAEHKRTGMKAAIKSIPVGKMEDQKLQREIRNHRCLNHANIVKVIDVVEKEDVVHIILEYCPKELFDYIVATKRMKEEEGRRIFRQLVAALEHCHENGVVHRDLKPENVLLDSNLNVKLADFGLSSEWHEGGVLTESCGSPNYAAPELLTKHCRYTGPEIDVWSAGVVLYTLLCNKLPFDADNCPDLFKLIKKGEYSTPAYVSQEAKDLIEQMLQVDPSRRITLAEVKRHPWFVSAGAPDELKPSQSRRLVDESLHKKAVVGSMERAGSDEPIRGDGSCQKKNQGGRTSFARWRWQRSTRNVRMCSTDDVHTTLTVL